MGRCAEVDNLPTGMHTRICTTCSMHNRHLPRDAGNGRLQGSLNSQALRFRLALKAVIVGAVVLNATSEFLFHQESASLLRQRRLAYIGALLVGVDLSIERETPSTRKGQHGSGLLFIRDNRRQVSAGRGMPFDCRRDEFFYFPSNSASACLGSFYTVVTDETRHQVATRGASAWLRHAHPITGNSVPQLIPPFLGRRPCRPQLRWYVDSAGNCGARASRAVPVDSFHQSCARQAGHLRSSKAPGPPW